MTSGHANPGEHVVRELENVRVHRADQRRPAQTALGLAQTEAAYQRARRKAAGLDGRARPASGRGAAAQAMPQAK